MTGTIRVAPGEIGEIVVRGRPGRNVMLGYYNDPKATPPRSSTAAGCIPATWG